MGKREENRLQKTRNHVPVPRRRLRQLEEIENQVEEAGQDSSAIRGRSATRKRKRADSDEDDDGATVRSASRARSSDVKGLPKEEDRQRAEKMRRKKQKMLEK